METKNSNISKRKSNTTSKIVSSGKENLETIPKYPSFNDYQNRLNSFVSWPVDHYITKEDLAKAGLFYTGSDDTVRCYFCGGGLEKWEFGDKPKEEHDEWFPNCPLAYKISNSQNMFIQNDVAENTTEKLTPLPDKSAEQKAIVSKENNIQESVEQLAEENRQLKEKAMCKICMDNRSSVTFLPCGHMMSCEMCASSITNCPICRVPVTGKLKLQEDIQTMYQKNEDVIIMQQSTNTAPKPPPRDLGINVEKPKFPQYAVYSKRLESFESWPAYLPVTKEDLVEAGLVYTGVDDSVRCYFCGGGLRNWERGDVPMEEHAKWYPQCPHIMLVKGQAYVEMLLKGDRPETDGSDSKQKLTDTPANHLESEAAQSCIQMGFSKAMVEKAINIFIRKHGNSSFKGKDLCEILFDIEEIPEDTETFNDENLPSDLSVDSTQGSLEDLLEENRKLKENKMCKICLDNTADVIFLPCGHMVSCAQCAPALVKCAICRQTINGQVKAFFSVVVAKQ